MYVCFHCSQVLDSSSMSVGGGVDGAELQEVKDELAENHKEMARVREQKEALQLQLDSLHDKLNVAEVRHVFVHVYTCM